MFPKFLPVDPAAILCASQARRLLDLPPGILTRDEHRRYNARCRRFIELATQSVPNPKRQHTPHGRPY